MNWKRYAAVAAGIILQTCLGGLYAFSAYVPALRESFSYSFGQTNLIFGLTTVMLTVSMVGAGRLFALRGPRICVLLSGLFYLIGHLLISFYGGNFLLFLFSYAFLVGSADGFGYVAPLAVGVRWFPKRKGVITGLAVAGYGGGAIVLKTLIERLFAYGYTVLEVFRIVGIAYGGIILICTFFFFPPPPAEETPPELSSHNLRKDKTFRAFFLTLFLGTLPGLMIIGNLKPLGLSFGFSESVAAAAISFVAIGNAVGRILWGTIHDHAQPRGTLLCLLLCVFCSPFLLFFSHGSTSLFLASAFFFGFAYGGNFTIIPAQTAIVFHPSNLSRVYPFVFLAHGLAGAGASLSGRIRDITGNFTATLVIAAICGLLGCFLYALLTRNSQKLRSH